MQISFDWDGRNVDGQPVDPNDTVMFYAEFVNSAGETVWYPPLADDGLPNTAAVRESITVTPVQAGLQPGTWVLYMHTVQVEPDGFALRSERSASTPPFVLAKPRPTAPTNLSIVV